LPTLARNAGGLMFTSAGGLPVAARPFSFS